LKNIELIRALPKPETHLHLEGALPWHFLNQKDPHRFAKEPFFRNNSFRYDSFSHFESILIEHALEIFKSAEDYYHVASSIFKNLKSQNVRYVETSFHAGMIEFLRIPGKEILEAISSASPDELEVRIFMGISRNAYTDYLSSELDQAIENWENLAGIDLHGPEELPLESWTIPFWEKAKKNDRILKAHAGEFGPSSNIDQAITKLGVRRVQHGVAARDSEATLNLIKENNVCLDMCPISNYKLKVINTWSEHPLKFFIEEGICCTLSTDDPFSFNNTLEEEYLNCLEKLNMEPTDLIKLAKNGFEVADLNLDKKKDLFVEINKLVQEIDEGRFSE
tara:strand:+ start:198 stop:1205 length:1008 start_codon:yes stop_codon:yes gene_type:complete